MSNQNTVARCQWCTNDPQYIQYHDLEWGKSTKDDNVLFEFLILESAQAGLSWLTILRRRENYRKAFAHFDARKVSRFTDKEIKDLLANEGIIRHEGKIKAAILNAKVFVNIQSEYGTFYNYLYSFLPDKKPIINHFKNINEVPAKSPISEKISKDLNRRGMRFFGPVICYAYMQAIGMVNDHIVSCTYR